jgi:integrase
MPRPKRAANKRRLTELYVRKLKPQRGTHVVWDTLQRGLAIRVQPTGAAAWKVIYARAGRTRWLHLGDVNAIGLADARTLAAEAMLEVARGKDPAAEKRAQRGAGTFAELAAKYVEQWAKKRNKSWRQADNLVKRYVLPRWGKLQASSITRADVKAMMARIEAPVLANQVLAATSAIFSWAVKEETLPTNPCKLVDRHETKSRSRILADSEVPRFWAAFDEAGPVAAAAFKVLLLTGQRPGEVIHMRREHIVDGWWEMPGQPVPHLRWPGTKNKQDHRIWLPSAAREIIAKLGDGSTGFVFAGRRGSAVRSLDAAMRTVCKQLGVTDKVTPHDLRRTHGSTITKLGFGRDAMNRIQNHKEGGIASVYDRHEYAEENKKVMETVAPHFMALVEGRPGDNVVAIRR